MASNQGLASSMGTFRISSIRGNRIVRGVGRALGILAAESPTHLPGFRVADDTPKRQIGSRVGNPPDGTGRKAHALAALTRRGRRQRKWMAEAASTAPYASVEAMAAPAMP